MNNLGRLSKNKVRLRVHDFPGEYSSCVASRYRWLWGNGMRWSWFHVFLGAFRLLWYVGGIVSIRGGEATDAQADSEKFASEWIRQERRDQSVRRRGFHGVTNVEQCRDHI